MHRRRVEITRKADVVDRELARRSADLPRSLADPGLKALSTAANHSALWLALAAALSTRKGAPRRAALRGLAAIGAASATTNLLGKPLFPRRRPAAHLLPRHRRFSDPPRSSSFPSGHAASAAAFATAVAMESPALGLAVAPIAAAVGYSRVHTGVHWPTDVLCGGALGAGLAWATRRWWPLRPYQPASVRSPTAAPALSEGDGVLVLVNPKSGDGTFDPEHWVSTRWPAAKVVRTRPDGDAVDELEEVLDGEGDAVRALGVAGGDGTVASVAALATRRGLPLAVLSAGTLNHFARDAGLDDSDAVAEAVDRGSAVRVDLGGVNADDHPPRWFLNTASIGGYPDMVRFREEWTGRWGKWPAGAAALVRVLHESRPLEVDLNGVRRQVWVLFVGNGSYAPRGFAPSWRPRLDGGLLDVRYVRADLPWSRLRFVVAALSGTLHRSRTYVQRDHRFLDVVVRGPAVAVATDGEIGPLGHRFRFAAHEDALSVYRPERA
ncbi:bifunctional phosphatase PAP2/diacylglycerol kinase family protein [Saccharopolyspora sp. MS10]|uniref:bifunctional phosphatase PAP2/diacylglycerol kinase family protein n=1 Tax=Saccharopolyspora sp. MS10 TaxID=3385973 RepID=UPI0039A1D17C